MIKIKIIYKRIAFILCAVFLLVFNFVVDIFYVANADESLVSVKDFSKVEIEDEDNSNGVSWVFNAIKEYAFDDDFQVLSVQEYCFSPDSAYDEYYGLYIYVYNPSGKEVGVNERINAVNLSTSFNSVGDPTSYSNFRLTYCDEAYNNTVYKFKVDLTNEYKTALRNYSMSFGNRRYDIASVQLRYTDRKLATDTAHAKTYLFTGYAKGLNNNTESTLTCYVKGLNTIEWDVHHTYFRTHDYQDNVCDQLNTVYFSVDEEHFADEKSLYGIKAEWYEYKTTPIFVTSNLNAYNTIKPYRAKTIDYVDDTQTTGVAESTLPFRIFWESYPITKLSGYSCTGYDKMVGQYGIGMFVDSYLSLLHQHEFYDAEKLSILSWLFYRAGEGSSKDFNVTGEDLESYIEELVDAGFTDSSNLYLFEDSIDKERADKFFANSKTKKGHVEQEIFTDELLSLTQEVDHSWFYKLWFDAEYEEVNYSPIVVFDKSDKDVLSGMTDETFASTYYVNQNDAKTVREYCLTELDKGKCPTLFRFANTDYYVSDAYFDGGYEREFLEINGYVAQTSVFEDFDVISLTFKDYEGAITVVPVSADPINIYSGVEPNPDSPLLKDDDNTWLEELIDVIVIVGGVILLGLLLAILAPILVPAISVAFGFLWRIIKGVVKTILLVIPLPFKWISNAIKKKKDE